MSEPDKMTLEETSAALQGLAAMIDAAMNGGRSPRTTGFVLLAFPFNAPPGARCNYVSNTSDRETILSLLKEMTVRFEEQRLATTKPEGTA